SYDGKVLIWKEQQSGQGGAAATTNTGYGQAPYGAAAATGGAGNWARIKEHSLHTASVNSISWAPHELGAIVACASSDGKLSVLSFKNDGTWGADIFNAHNVGCNAVSWAPATLPGSLITPTPGVPNTNTNAPPSTASVKRFASAGCDNLVKIWGFREDNQTWVEEEVLKGHTDWVRDVAWAPNIGLPRSYIATASQDRTVIIHSKSTPSAPWTQTFLHPTADANETKFPDVVWRVSWSLAGNILAVSCGDGKSRFGRRISRARGSVLARWLTSGVECLGIMEFVFLSFLVWGCGGWRLLSRYITLISGDRRWTKQLQPRQTLLLGTI
ncbi:hypothetical protein RSAG8_13326, partial [Rhizoctonia solani AG-8 WAC10335]